MITFTASAPSEADPPLPTSGGSYVWDTAAADWVRRQEAVAAQPETNAASADPSAADQAEEHE